MTAKYLLTGYIRIDADSEEEAIRKFDEAGLGPDVEVIDGVWVCFEGPWDDIDPIDEPECICPPGLVERGGFKGGCPAHA